MNELVLDWPGGRMFPERKTLVMGIVNATPDSFSDGGRFFGFEKAVQRGKELAAEGADILDIGGESSRPFAEPVTEAEEMERVIPVIEALVKEVDVPISIDTVKASVAGEAVRAGAGMINDISALKRDPEMVSVVKEADVPVILMHMQGTPETMQINPEYGDLLGEIVQYLQKRADFAVKSGIKKERIILDPGIGFGKTVPHNLSVINHMNTITSLGFPVLIGPSRKAFVQKILAQEAGENVTPDSDECENGTLAALGAAVARGCHIVRVHDVKRAKSFLTIVDAIESE